MPRWEVLDQPPLLVSGHFTSSQKVELILGIVKSIRTITEMGKLSISPHIAQEILDALREAHGVIQMGGLKGGLARPSGCS